VPHNLYLTTKYNAHINVEVCNTIGAVKYLYKYVYKGSDKITFAVDQPNYQNDESATIKHDEVKDFLDARYVSASEACWRIFEFCTNKQKPKTTRLPVHLENEQQIFFKETQDLAKLAETNHETPLTHYLKLNLTNLKVRSLAYYEMPIYFRWNTASKQWTERIR
jgi:hypothetical protein